MATSKLVSMTSPVDVDSAAIARRRAMAEALQKDSMEPVQAASYNGIQAPVSWTQGLAKMLQAYGARQGMEKADTQEKALLGQQNERRSADMSALIGALGGRQATPGGLQEDASGNVTEMPAQAAQTPLQGLQKAMPMIQDPSIQQMGMGLMAQYMKPQEPFTLSPGAQRVGSDGRVIASAPFKPDDGGFNLSPGQTRYNPQGQPIVKAPTLPQDETNKPYFSPVQTAQGVFAFNARTGRMEPVQVGGAPVVGAANDPALQGRLAAARAGGKETGEAAAQAQVDLPRVIDNASNAIGLIDQMIGPEGPEGRGKPHPGFSSAVGMRVPGLGYIPGTDTSNFNAMLDQVKGGAFLEAFNSLKGGGQITEVEGRKATDAVTRMQAAQSEREFIKAAREYQGIVRKGVERAQVKAGAQPASAPQQADPLGIRGKKK